MSTEIIQDNTLLAKALAKAGADEELRNFIFDALRLAETRAENPAEFRAQVRWPLVLSLLEKCKTHRVQLLNGLIYEISASSRIEKALLLSSETHPDHVWEPQTTRLLTLLAEGAKQVIVGGAYIGDHVLPMAQVVAGVVHAFEPMADAFNMLLHNIQINNLQNIVAHRLGLWDRSGEKLSLDGALALASSVPARDQERITGESVQSITIDDYVVAQNLRSVELIMLDTEGGEARALSGAAKTLDASSPHIVFEIHRHFVDWSNGLENTDVIRFLTSRGYSAYAIRDFHDNYPMSGRPIEVIPVDKVYLEGPPHGFNVLASKYDVIQRLGLRVVKSVSPKLLLDKDPALHHSINY
jgi:FkbM family methyltransferase